MYDGRLFHNNVSVLQGIVAVRAAEQLNEEEEEEEEEEEDEEQSQEEVDDFHTPLPVSTEPKKSEILSKIRNNRVVVINGETG